MVCRGDNACRNLSIDVWDSNNLDLVCEGTYACTGIIVENIISWAVSKTDSSNLNITCIGSGEAVYQKWDYTCSEANIIGGGNTTIKMACIEGQGTCPSVHIEGGDNSSINLLCSSPEMDLSQLGTCWNTTVRG